MLRKHELFPKSSYHGNCPGVATIWQETDGGVAANVRVKRPAPRAASGKNWELDLIWDAPVSSFEVVSNGVSEQTSGQAFKVRDFGLSTTSTRFALRQVVCWLLLRECPSNAFALKTL